MEIGTEAVQFPEKEYINGITVAVRDSKESLLQYKRHMIQEETFRGTLVGNILALNQNLTFRGQKNAGESLWLDKAIPEILKSL